MAELQQVGRFETQEHSRYWSDPAGIAHPFEMDRHSLWLVAASMIFVGGLNFCVVAVAGTEKRCQEPFFVFLENMQIPPRLQKNGS